MGTMGKRVQSTVKQIDLPMLKRQKARLVSILHKGDGTEKTPALVRLTHSDYEALQGILHLLDAVQDNAISESTKEWTVLGMYDGEMNITADHATAKDGMQAMRKAALERKDDDGASGFNLICAIPKGGSEAAFAYDVEPVDNFLARSKRKIKKEDAI